MKKSRVICVVALTWLSVSVLARPNYHALPSDKALPGSKCIMPDGSSPKRGPDMHCYTPEQFLRAYGIDKLHQLGLTGKGQTIILADSFGSPTLQQDLDHFSDTFNLPRTQIQFIYPNGTYVNPMATDEQAGWAGETTLDLEWAHAVAPEATLVNLVTNTAETTGMEGLPELFAGFKLAIRKYPHAILSMSFGTGEKTFAAADVEKFLRGSYHQVFQDAIDSGYTLLASTGDSGSIQVGNDRKYETSPDIQYPAGDPLVLAVGGTALEAGWVWTPEGTLEDYWNCKRNKVAHCPTNLLKSAPSDSIIETAWKEDWAPAGGGGGISTIFEAPDYQANLDPEVLAQVNGQRATPDISLNAAINGGVEVYTSYAAAKDKKAADPKWISTGGTSCAAPETAGLVALVGQGASDILGVQTGAGDLNSLLYRLPQGDFNDIVPVTFGAISVDGNMPYFNTDLLKQFGPTRFSQRPISDYEATEGYDMATGLGSPRAERLVADLMMSVVSRQTHGK